tara:strand:- start:1164 stop:1943 length:780 start_codon:yes stop_codon:yes gene_type:complete
MYIDKKNFLKSLANYGDEGPFDHCVIDNFFNTNIAKKLEKEFPSFNSKSWLEYDNALEIKKTCNNWNAFPPLTYQVFNYLNSQEFTSLISKSIFKNKKLFSDIGLNGGGWHIHKSGGKLNPHLDYSLHPKTGLQRKLNIIIYLNSKWKESWGGHLGFWGNESKERPGEIKKKLLPLYNRAILFDTSQNSWHGLPEPVDSPLREYRKSIAVYYLCIPPKNISRRGKALYAPTLDQENDKTVLKLIKERSSVSRARDTYRN